MTRIKAIYDNGGKTLDRYTIYLDSPAYPAIDEEYLFNCISSAYDPRSVYMHSVGTLGKHNGKKIRFNNLPKDVREALTRDKYYEDINFEDSFDNAIIDFTEKALRRIKEEHRLDNKKGMLELSLFLASGLTNAVSSIKKQYKDKI